MLITLFWSSVPNPWLELVRPESGHGAEGHSAGEYEECKSVLAGKVCFFNSLLRIKGANRTVVYRIGRYLLGLNAWEASWPD